MDWYQEGRQWVDRWFTSRTYGRYGRYATTHERALLRLTRTSQDQESARRGFRDRMREIAHMPMMGVDKLLGNA